MCAVESVVAGRENEKNWYFSAGGSQVKLAYATQKRFSFQMLFGYSSICVWDRDSDVSLTIYKKRESATELQVAGEDDRWSETGRKMLLFRPPRLKKCAIGSIRVRKSLREK